MLRFFNDSATTEIYTLSLHDALPISLPVAGEALAVQRIPCPGLQLAEDRAHAVEVEVGVPADRRLHVVVADVDGEQAERAEVAGVRRDEGAGQPEDVHQPAGQKRAGAAEGGEREVADVETPGDRDLAQRVGLVPRGDLEDAGGGALEVQAQRAAESPQPLARGLGRQREDRKSTR